MRKMRKMRKIKKIKIKFINLKFSDAKRLVITCPVEP